MPFLVSIFISALGSMVARVLIALGIGYISYQGVSALNQALINQMITLQSSLPQDLVLILARLGIFQAMSIIISAYVASISLLGIVDGARRLAMTTTPTN